MTPRTWSAAATLGPSWPIVLMMLVATASLPSWTSAQSWLNGGGDRPSCPPGRVMTGLCDFPTCGNDFPLLCSTYHTITGSGDTTMACVPFTTMYSCPNQYVLLRVCVSNTTFSCNSTGVPCDMEVYCVSTSSPPIFNEVCEWRPATATAKFVSCGADEIAGGVCSPGDSGTCQYQKNPGEAFIQCCYTGRSNSRCAPASYWQKTLGTVCAADTLLTALCSGGQCDPAGAVSQSDTRANVTALYFCQGMFLTRPTGGYWTPCGNFLACNMGDALMSVATCAGGKFRGYCQIMRFSMLDRLICVNSTGSTNLWCPDSFAMTEACLSATPSAPMCNNFTTLTYVKCCAVRQYFQGGMPCRQDVVYTAIGALRASKVPYGLNTDAPAGIALKRFTDSDGCNSCYYAYGMALNGDASYVYVLLGSVAGHIAGDDNSASSFIIRFPVGGFDPTVLHVAGSITAKGYTAPDDVILMNWHRRYQMLFDFTTTSAVIPADVRNALFIAEQTMIRIMSTTFDNTWYAQAYAGNNTRKLALVNGTQYRAATFRFDHTCLAYRETTQQLFTATFGAIFYQPGSNIWYYAGNGVLNGNPYPTDNNTFRTDQQVGFIKGLAIDDDALLYFADSASLDGIVFVDLRTGYLTGLACGMNAPSSIAVYSPLDASIGKIIFATTSDSSIWKVTVNALTAVQWAGDANFGVLQPGSTDRVPLLSARFWSPSGLIATRNQLYIADKQNSAIRVVLLDPCTVQFNSTDLCRSCSPGFWWYPRCRDTCTLADDCYNRAASVSGAQGDPSNCSCKCNWPFGGKNCLSCLPQFDPNFGCLACAAGYVGRFPNCHTETISLSATRGTPSFSGEPTKTITITPPATVTPTRTLSLTPPPTLTRKRLSKSATVAPPPPPLPPPPPPGSGGPGHGHNGQWCGTRWCTNTRTLSVSHPLTPSRPLTRSDSHTLHILGRGPNGRPRRPNGLTLTSSLSRPSQTRSATLSMTPPITRTAPITSTVSRTVPVIHHTTVRNNATDPPTGTRAPPATMAPTTPTPTTRRPTLAPRTPKPVTAPPKPGTAGNSAPTLSGRATNDISIQAVATGYPVEGRMVTLVVYNTFIDPTKCELPNLVTFKVPARTGNVDFLQTYTSWCTLTNITLAFSSSKAVAVSYGVSITADLTGVLYYNDSLQVPINLAAYTVPQSVTTTATAAASASVAVAAIGGGAGGASGIQTLGALSMIACADPKLKGSMKGARSAVAPWDLGPEYIGPMLGNFAILLIVSALVTLGTGGLYLKKKRDADQGVVPAEEEFPDPTLPHAMTLPLPAATITIGTQGHLYTFTCLTLQGIAIESAMLLFDNTVPVFPRIVSAFALLYSFSLPCLMFWFLRKKFTGQMATYRYVSAGLPLPARIIMPSQFWLPLAYANQHGTMFKTIKRADLLFAVWDPLLKVNFTSIIAAIQAEVGPPCQAQFGCLGAVFLLEAIYRVVRWPQHTPVGNIGPLAAALTATLVASSQGFGVEIVPMETTMLFQSYLSLACSIVNLVVANVDERIWQKRELKARYLQNDFVWDDTSIIIDADAEEAEKAKMTEQRLLDSTTSNGGDGGENAQRPSGSASRNPLLKVPAKDTAVPDSSSTLAILIAMKKEQAAVSSETAAGAKPKSKPLRKGRRPADDDSDDYDL